MYKKILLLLLLCAFYYFIIALLLYFLLIIYYLLIYTYYSLKYMMRYIKLMVPLLHCILANELTSLHRETLKRTYNQ